MTSRKLSESDKQQILHLYRQPGETTSTLASRFGVSNSTISRILKNSFSEAEYEALIQQKRGNRASGETTLALDTETANFEVVEAEAVEAFEAVKEPETVESEAVEVESEAVKSEPIAAIVREPLELEEAFATGVPANEPAVAPIQERSQSLPLEESPTLTANGRRLRKRSSAPTDSSALTEPAASIAPIAPPTVKKKILNLVEPSAIAALDHSTPSSDDLNGVYLDSADDVAVVTAGTIAGEALLQDEADLASDLENELDDDLDDDLEEGLDDDDLDDLEDGALLIGGRIAGKAMVHVLPLAEASLPRTCYLVVDRSAELVARPLKEFGDLGQIPEAEISEKTLPVFDNHRVAKRYSNPRTQRVIKLPDAQVLQKTSSHLQAKGITRLLIDGQVYAL